MEQQRFTFNVLVIRTFKYLLSLGGTNSKNFVFLEDPIKKYQVLCY